MTDTVLPPCPTCASEYVYEMDALLVGPECAHEWSRDEASTADDEWGAEGERVIRDAVGNGPMQLESSVVKKA